MTFDDAVRRVIDIVTLNESFSNEIEVKEYVASLDFQDEDFINYVIEYIMMRDQIDI